MYQIIMLTDLTPSEKANSACRRVLFHLDMVRSYLRVEKFNLARIALRDARRSLRHVSLEQVTDVSALRGTLAMSKMGRRIDIEEADALSGVYDEI